MEIRMTRFARSGFAIGLALSALYAPSAAYAQNGNAVAPARRGSDSQAAASASSAHDTLSTIDQQFVQDAGTAGATEIAASKLALSNSSDAHVKSFAQRMLADHTRLARNLDVAAKQRGITAAPSADASVTGSLETLHGDAFDKAYILQVALAGHQKAITVFSTESMKGNDALLKNTAARALPIIKHHYAMAQQLAKAKGIAS
jgi:putative membrane protein